MFNVTVDGKAVSVKEGSTILDAAQAASVSIPTLCWMKDLNEIGSCRICVVETEGDDALSAACNTPVRDGMNINTRSPRVIAARRENMRTILEGHRSECTTCERSAPAHFSAPAANNVGELIRSVFDLKHG